MTSLKTNLIQTAKIITLGLVLGLGVNFLFAYTGPLSSPPTCIAGNPGCDAPINVGSIEQMKTGRLTLPDLFAGNLTITNDFKITKGTQPLAGKVLTSDASGVATWQTLASGSVGGFTKMAVINYASAAGDTTNVTGSNGSYTFRVPTGVTKVKVRAWGGGGSGYCPSGNANKGGGGGGYGEGVYTVVPGQSYSIQVGDGQNYQGGYQNNGNSSFGALITSMPGNNADISLTVAIGGTSDGQFNIQGGWGSVLGAGSSPQGGGPGVAPGGGGTCSGVSFNSAFVGAKGRVVVEY